MKASTYKYLTHSNGYSVHFGTPASTTPPIDMFKFFLIAAFVACAFANNVDFEECPGLPAPISFGIPECNSDPCVIRVGQTITLVIGINVASQTTSMPVTATVTSGGVSFDFPLPTGDACAAVSTGCPLTPGNYLVTFPVTIAGVNAGTETSVRVQINNQNNAPIACGSITTTFA